MHTYTTTAGYAAAHGLDVADVRALARKGKLSGAIRVGGNRSTWAIPVDAVVLGTDPVNTAPLELGSSRGAADTRPVGADAHHLMSSSGDTPAQTARRVEARVRAVNTRPAQALADVVFMAADVAAMHTQNRDASCTRCGWTWPCPDRRALEALLLHADRITDGTR